MDLSNFREEYLKGQLHRKDLWIFFNIAGLVAAVVGEENKARPVKIFEQHGA